MQDASCFYFEICVLVFMCVFTSIYLCAPRVSTWPEESVGFLVLELQTVYGLQTLYGYWDLKLGPLEGRPVRLTTESSSSLPLRSF